MFNRFTRALLCCNLILFTLTVAQMSLVGQAFGTEELPSSKIAPAAIKANTKAKAPALSKEILEIQQYAKVKITALDVPWPPPDCKKTTWRAQIVNTNPDSVYQLQLKGWQFNEKAQRWDVASYSELFNIEGNQTKILEGQWDPGPYTTKFKMVLHPKGKTLKKYEEREKALAIPASANLAILPPEFNGDSWKVSLKNNGSHSECAISVQTYLVKKSTGARVATGGHPAQIPANGVGLVQNNITEPNWRTNFDEFLVELRRAPTWTSEPGPGWTKIKSQSFAIPGHNN